MIFTVADQEAPETRAFLDDLWRLCVKHELMIHEGGQVVLMTDDDFGLGYDLSELGDLLPGKRGPA